MMTLAVTVTITTIKMSIVAKIKRKWKNIKKKPPAAVSFAAATFKKQYKTNK